MSSFEIPVNCCLLFIDDVEEILGIETGASYLLHNGRLVSRCEPLQHGRRYYIFPRVLGGKGGFGSMLRAIGAQIEKTTSREACRDLSGRRIRDVNNEKKLKEWVAKQADREREKEEREERRRAKRAKYLEDNPGKMDDPEFNAQYNQIMSKNEAAVQEGLAKMKDRGPTSRKRKADSNGTLDKYDRWSIVGGVNMEDLDSDSGSENSDANSSEEAQPSCSLTQPISHTATSSTSSSPKSSPESSEVAAAATAAAASSNAETSMGAGSDNLSSAESAISSETSMKEEGASPAKVAKMANGHPSSLKEQETKAEEAVKADRENESTEPIDLNAFSSAEELHSLGMERLKFDLMRKGLKCGGNLQERAQRLFSVKGLAPEDIPAKLLAKGKGQGKSSQK